MNNSISLSYVSMFSFIPVCLTPNFATCFFSSNYSKEGELDGEQHDEEY